MTSAFQIKFTFEGALTRHGNDRWISATPDWQHNATLLPEIDKDMSPRAPQSGCCDIPFTFLWCILTLRAGCRSSRGYSNKGQVPSERVLMRIMVTNGNIVDLKRPFGPFKLISFNSPFPSRKASQGPLGQPSIFLPQLPCLLAHCKHLLSFHSNIVVPVYLVPSIRLLTWH